MSASTGTARKERLLPQGPGVGRFAAAGLLNSLGGGFFISFALLFFQDVAALPLSTVGPGLTAASLAILPLLPAVGRLADRIGPRKLLVTASLTRAVAFAGFLLLDGLAAFLVLAMLSSLGTRAEQIGSPALAAALAGEDSTARSRWLALYRTVFNAGIGGGALLGGLLVTAGVGYPTLGLLTAVGFAVAALLYPTAPTPVEAPATTTGTAATAPDSEVPHGPSPWRDSRFVRVSLAGAALFLAATALENALPVYLLDSLRLPGWTVGVMFGLNTTLLMFAQLPLDRRLNGQPPGRLLGAGTLLATVSMLLFSLATMVGAGPAIVILIVAMTGWTVSELIVFQTVAVVLTSLPPESRRGVYLAANQLPVGIAMALSPLLVTSALALSPAALFWLLAVLIAAAGLITRTESPSS